MVASEMYGGIQLLNGKWQKRYGCIRNVWRYPTPKLQQAKNN